MIRTYARVAAVVLLATGVVGFFRLWGFDPQSGLYQAGVGALFAYAGFWQGDTAIVRQIVGGMGVLLLVVKAAVILGTLLAYGVFEHGPAEATYLVVGVGSVLAARYLRDGEPGGGSR